MKISLNKKEVIKIYIEDSLIKYDILNDLSFNELTYCIINTLEDIAKQNNQDINVLIDTYIEARKMSTYISNIPKNFIKIWGDNM